MRFIRSLPRGYLLGIGFLAWVTIRTTILGVETQGIGYAFIAIWSSILLGLMVAAMFATRGNRRAYGLLLSHLDGRQKVELLQRGSFVVTGSDGVRYRIKRSFVYGITTKNRAYCAYPPGVPIYDAMLAQKLLIESNAEEFKARAYSKSHNPFH